MAGEAKRLQRLTLAQLRELAAKANLDLGTARSKTQIVAMLQDVPGILELMNAQAEAQAQVPAEPGAPVAPSAPSAPPALPGEPYRDEFEGASLRSLFNAAKAFGVTVTAGNREAYEEAFLRHPRAGEIASKLEELRELEEASSEIRAVGHDIEGIAQALQIPDLADPDVDPLLAAGLGTPVEFAKAEDLLDQVVRRYGEQRFEQSVGAAEESLTAARIAYDSFLNRAWAHALLAAQSMILDAAHTGASVDEAVVLLAHAKRAYKDGKLDASREALVRLGEAARALQRQGAEDFRKQIAASQETVRRAGSLGADVAPAEELLAQAHRSVQAGEGRRALVQASKAAEIATLALKSREAAVRRQLESILRAVESTRKFGTDTSRAEEILSRARAALDSGQLLTAAELVTQAELQAQNALTARAPPPPPPAPAVPTPPPPPATEDRRAAAVRRTVQTVSPVLDEGESFSLDVVVGRVALDEAERLLTGGQFEIAAAAARRADEFAKTLLHAIVQERRRRGITKPAQGICARCRKNRLTFYDDGWGRCPDCGNTFRWRQVPPRKA